MTNSTRSTLLSFIDEIFNVRSSDLDLSLSPLDYDFDSKKVLKFIRRANEHYDIDVKVGQIIGADDFEEIFNLFETTIKNTAIQK